MSMGQWNIFINNAIFKNFRTQERHHRFCMSQMHTHPSTQAHIRAGSAISQTARQKVLHPGETSCELQFKGPFGTWEMDSPPLLSLPSVFLPPYSCDTVSLAFAKMLSLGKPVRGWYETERSYHTSALWLCTDVPCLSFLTVHYSFELPFLHSWSCVYVWRTFFPSFLNRLLFLRMLPFFCAASAHFIFFSFLLEYDIALKRINAIMWCIWQGYFQKGKCFSSTMIWKTEEASLKILWPIWVTSDQKKGKRHKEL